MEGSVGFCLFCFGLSFCGGGMEGGFTGIFGGKEGMGWYIVDDWIGSQCHSSPFGVSLSHSNTLLDPRRLTPRLSSL